MEPAVFGPRRLRLPELMVDVNDGIVATAGIVEGFVGAGSADSTVLVGAVAALVGGSVAIIGARYAEERTEQEVAEGLVEEERRQRALSPQELLDEVADHYVARGVERGLAAQVAAQLGVEDALITRAEAKYGLDLDRQGPSPVRAAGLAGLAFALGSAIPLVVALFVPDGWRFLATFVAVLVSLSVTSVISARTGHAKASRIVRRTVLIGAASMLLTFLGGSLLGG